MFIIFRNNLERDSQLPGRRKVAENLVRFAFKLPFFYDVSFFPFLLGCCISFDTFLKIQLFSKRYQNLHNNPIS